MKVLNKTLNTVVQRNWQVESNLDINNFIASFTCLCYCIITYIKKLIFPHFRSKPITKTTGVKAMDWPQNGPVLNPISNCLFVIGAQIA